MFLRVLDEPGVPEPEDDSRREDGFPVLVRRYDLVHEREEPRGIVVDFTVDVELDVLVLRLS